MRLINSNKRPRDIVLLSMRSFVNYDPCKVFKDSRTGYTACWNSKDGRKMYVGVYSPNTKRWDVCISSKIITQQSSSIITSNNVIPYLKDAIKHFIDTYNFEF